MEIGAELGGMDDAEAAGVIQKYFKGFRVRRLVSVMFIERIIRVWDSTIGRDMFYDKHTGLTSWEPTKRLLRAHIDKLQFVEQKSR